MTIREIANLAGVSISTVSKVINNKDVSVTPETRERVLRIAKEYNYRPYGNQLERNERTFLIGVILKPSMECSLLMQGIVTAAQNHGYSVLIYYSNSEDNNELKNITALVSKSVDAIIWEPVNGNSIEYAKELDSHNIPYFAINEPSFPGSFLIDYKFLGSQLAELLIKYHHEKFGCIVVEHDYRSNHIIEGFRQCLFNHNLPYTDDLLISSNSENSFLEAYRKGYTAVLSAHYAEAITFYENAAKLHYSIPDDISIVSFRNESRTDLRFPEISNVPIPYRQFGAYVCNNLISLIETSSAVEEKLYQSSGIILSSCKTLKDLASIHNNKVVVIGPLNVDTTMRVSEMPTIGKSTTILGSTTSPGGKGTNQAVGAARLGCNVSLIGNVGEDYESSIFYDLLESEHISASGVNHVKGVATGRAYIYLQGSSESSISVLTGANGRLSPNDIHNYQHLFSNCQYCLSSTEIPVDTVFEAMKIAHKFNARNVIKPSLCSKLPDDFYKLSDIFVPNALEAHILCPSLGSIELIADYFFEKGARTVIITLGSKGCYLKTDNIEKYYSASDITPVDTTGGADAFISCLVAYLIKGYDLDRSIKIANYAAGFCISRQGVAPILIDSDGLEKYIKLKVPNLLRKE